MTFQDQILSSTTFQAYIGYKAVDKIMWCAHLNETSWALLLYAAISIYFTQ